MTVRFNLPDVGEGLDQAEIVDLLVAQGDNVGRDQPLLLVLTDKAEVELPSPAAGKVVRFAVAPGDIVEVGALLVEIDDGRPSADEPAPAAPTVDGSAPEAPAAETPTVDGSAPEAPAAETPAEGAAAGDGDRAVPVAQAAPDTATTPSPLPSLRPKASPATRRLAVELGVDLAAVSGTGPGGRITADDVRAHGEAPAPVAEAAPPSPQSPSDRPPSSHPPPRVATEAGVTYGSQPLRGIRRATAAAMTRSWSEIPHITGMNEIDATGLLAARDRLRAAVGDDGPRVSALAIMIRAVARALRSHPMANAGVEPGAEAVTVHEACNIGVAVATDHGLVVPVIEHADQRGVLDLAAEIEQLAETARHGRLTPEQLRGGTSTVTNYGSLGNAHYATPLIRPGEAVIVGFGSIGLRPWVVDDEVVARPVLPIVVSADHRIIDGDLLNSFANQIHRDLADPIRMLL
jgi:pyruvate dehydrogenase E2 component (dihydrolipoamide acetyltransferase)